MWCGAARCGAVWCGAVRGEGVVSRVGPSGWNCTLFTPRGGFTIADDYHGSINWRAGPAQGGVCCGCAAGVLHGVLGSGVCQAALGG